MIKAGKIDIMLTIDNTSRHNFAGHVMKLEQTGFKIVLPGSPSAQQSSDFATPMCLMDKEETYASVQKVLKQVMHSNLSVFETIPDQSTEPNRQAHARTPRNCLVTRGVRSRVATHCMNASLQSD
jgi:hypothetical protein